MPRHTVRWTSTERDFVFSLVPEPTPVPWIRMWRQVMKALPPDRRRSLLSASASTNMKHEYEHWRKSRPEFRPPEKLVVPELGPTETPEQMAMKQPGHAITEPEIIVVEKIVKEEPDYGVIPTSTLARILLERLALMDQFDARFREMEAMIRAKNLAEKTHDVRLGPLPPTEPEKERKIRIAIVGPLDSQAREIEARTASTPKPVELRFYDKDQQHPRPAGSVEYAIVTRHCNHAWYDKMKAALPADRVFFVDSGIQSVVQKVYDISARRDA